MVDTPAETAESVIAVQTDIRKGNTDRRAGRRTDNSQKYGQINTQKTDER